MRSIQGLQRRPERLWVLAWSYLFWHYRPVHGPGAAEETGLRVPVIFLPGVLVRIILFFLIQYLFKQVEQFRFYRWVSC